MVGGWREVQSARGIESVYMYFNGTGIWGGETKMRRLMGEMRKPCLQTQDKTSSLGVRPKKESSSLSQAWHTVSPLFLLYRHSLVEQWSGHSKINNKTLNITWLASLTLSAQRPSSYARI